MLIPYKVDVPMARWPYANWAILALMLVAFLTVDLVQASSSLSIDSSGRIELSPMHLSPYVLDGFSLRGLFGHMWLHVDVIHLVGNGLFLWVFGNAICAKVGNAFYPVIYVGLGLAAGLAHLVFVGGPVAGASGAINGIVGMYMVLYPLNSVSCAYGLFYVWGRFSMSSLWLILLWLAFDIWGAAAGGGSVAYFAHLGGFAAGVGLAVLALKMRWLEVEPYEESLLQIIHRKWGRRPADPPAPRPAAVAEAVSSGATEAAVTVRCGCGQTMRAARKYIGRSVKCPVCDQPVLVCERRRRGAG
jgi:membrane associated rhomboid family serine protease